MKLQEVLQCRRSLRRTARKGKHSFNSYSYNFARIQKEEHKGIKEETGMEEVMCGIQNVEKYIYGEKNRDRLRKRRETRLSFSEKSLIICNTFLTVDFHGSSPGAFNTKLTFLANLWPTNALYKPRILS
jgi:hypothetical protein